MIDTTNIFDNGALSSLKRAAQTNSPEAIKATAKQFEAVFLQLILKSMRDASPQDGMFDSETTRFYQGMGDQQMAAVLAQKGGIGLAAALERQLMQSAVSPDNATQTDTTMQPSFAVPPRRAATSPMQVQQPVTTPVEMVPTQQPSVVPPTSSSASSASGDPQQFVSAVWPQAANAASQLGVPPHFLVAQAALETGWGKSELRKVDGSPSYNLFNIKAGSSWNGPVVEAQTTEYENGIAQSRKERFRAYGSYAEAFQDYANIVKQSPRYAAALGQGEASGFAKALQSGGYATDPAYADKLTRVINGSALRQGLIASAR